MNAGVTLDQQTRGMSIETLISSYILRLSVHKNRWRIGLQDVRTGEWVSFDSFDRLADHLEQLSQQGAGVSGTPARAPPETTTLKKP